MRRFQQLHCSFHLFRSFHCCSRSNRKQRFCGAQVRPDRFSGASWGLAATEFKNRIEEKSGGSMTVEIYPSSTSGSEADSLAGMLVGTLP